MKNTDPLKRLLPTFSLFQELKESFQSNGFIPRKHFYMIAWVFVLSVIYIFLKHNSHKLAVRLEKDKMELRDKRAMYINLKSDFMFDGKHSEVSKRLGEASGMDNFQSPIIVKVEQ